MTGAHGESGWVTFITLMLNCVFFDGISYNENTTCCFFIWHDCNIEPRWLLAKVSIKLNLKQVLNLALKTCKHI